MILATAAALGLAALIRPHLALLALALVAPLARTLQAQPHDIDILAAATIGGALIAAGRPRLTPLAAGRPRLFLPAVLFAAAMLRIFGLLSPAPVGMAVAYVAARHALDGVTRPIHLIRAAIVGGIVAVAFEPQAAEAGASGVGVTVSLVAGVLALGSLIWMLTAFLIRVARGFRAFFADRVLMGALAAIAGFVVLLVRDPMFGPELMIPFGILIGATLARADGDAQQLAHRELVEG